jgi:aspartyl-tRNA(Asn)/glutamyl-tRNA(Gln) amidotransferase subunit C
MALTLTRHDVERIAALAHLELTDEEKTLFARQLAGILGYAERLQDVDTASVSAASGPMATPPPLRDDLVRASLPQPAALANAPDHAHGLFKVPKVLGS